MAVSSQNFEDGVDGKGGKWEDGIDDDQAERDFEAGITADAAGRLASNASARESAYVAGVAEAFGLDANDITVGSEWANSFDDEAQNKWQERTSNKGAKWRARAKGQGDKWEKNTKAQSDKWLRRAKAGLTGER